MSLDYNLYMSDPCILNSKCGFHIVIFKVGSTNNNSYVNHYHNSYWSPRGLYALIFEGEFMWFLKMGSKYNNL